MGLSGRGCARAIWHLAGGVAEVSRAALVAHGAGRPAGLGSRSSARRATYLSAVQAIAAPVSALTSSPAPAASAGSASANGHVHSRPTAADLAAPCSARRSATGCSPPGSAGSAALAARWLLRWNAARIVVRRATMSLVTQRAAFDAAPALRNALFRVRSAPPHRARRLRHIPPHAARA